jgi:hypothetical protein
VSYRPLGRKEKALSVPIFTFLLRMGSIFSREVFAEELFSKIVDEADYEGLSLDYGFENLVFEGGGPKGVAYIGAMKVSLQ